MYFEHFAYGRSKQRWGTKYPLPRKHIFSRKGSKISWQRITWAMFKKIEISFWCSSSQLLEENPHCLFPTKKGSCGSPTELRTTSNFFRNAGVKPAWLLAGEAAVRLLVLECLVVEEGDVANLCFSSSPKNQNRLRPGNQPPSSPLSRIEKA